MNVARALACLCIVASACASSWALIGTENRGKWPSHWPKELDPLRAHSRTTMVAHGIQEDVYEISFTSAEEFAQAWPFLISVKDQKDKSQGPDPIDSLVANWASTHGLWQNGMSPIIDLPSTAPVEQVVTSVFEKTGFDQGHVTSHTICQVRKVEIPGGFGGPYTAVLLDTNFGPKIMLLRREGNVSLGWWSRVYDAKP